MEHRSGGALLWYSQQSMGEMCAAAHISPQVAHRLIMLSEQWLQQDWRYSFDEYLLAALFAVVVVRDCRLQPGLAGGRDQWQAR